MGGGIRENPHNRIIGHLHKGVGMRKLLRFQALTFAFIFGFITTNCYAVPGDFDGDGRSDLSLALGLQNGTFWAVRLASGGSPLIYVFNVRGDALVTGQFYRNNNQSYPGVVSVRGAQLPLEWYIKTPQGLDALYRFGVPGDIVPNQGDLDCDHVTDLTVVRNEKSPTRNLFYKYWYVALSSQPGKMVRVRFGKGSDKVFTADLDGDGCRELLVLRPGYSWYGRPLLTKQISQVQWGRPGDIPLAPQDLDGDMLADYIVARPEGNGQRVYVRYSTGTTKKFRLGSKGTIPMIGNFAGSDAVPQFAFWEREQGTLSFRNSDGSLKTVEFGFPIHALVRPDGTVVQPGDDGRFGTNPNPPPGVPNDPTGKIRCTGQIQLRDGGGGYVHNPRNSRRTIKEILPREYTFRTRAVKVAHNGQILDSLRLGGFEYGGRQRWYGHQSVAWYPDNLLVIVELNNGQQDCVLVPDPQRRYD